MHLYQLISTSFRFRGLLLEGGNEFSVHGASASICIIWNLDLDPSALPAKRSRIVLIIFPAKIPRAWPPSLADFVENDNAIVAKIKEGQKWRLQLNSGIHT